MHKLIGIDTGGTYTDAVLFEDGAGVLAKAKALTTPQDLAAGIAEAVDAVMSAGRVAAGDIGMVALSTTLATNAIVEQRGGRIGLVMIGFAEPDLARAGLADALKDDAVLLLRGGHDAFGTELASLDLPSLDDWLGHACGAVEGYAVAGHFSVANPDHEEQVRRAIERRAHQPVTCSHDLTARLNGPQRALTAVLNARLIGIIHHLVDAAAGLLAARGIAAPLMIVKGDGSLLAVAEARRRPIETILSGPAASLVGAGYLTGLARAIVSDIGGTTTDIGLLLDGRPRLDPAGATVGSHTTSVEAVAMRTVGLGADSEVRLAPGIGPGRIDLGPRRVVPVSLLASRHADAVHAGLDRQLGLTAAPELAGRFAFATGRSRRAALSPSEAECLDALSTGPAALDQLLNSYRRRAALSALLTAGDVAVAAFCPSDAAHVLRLHSAWDRDAAVKTATLLARQRGTGGGLLAADAETVSRMVVDGLVRTSAERLLDATLGEDGIQAERPSLGPVLQNALSGRRGWAEIVARVTAPIIALGASARVYYPEVGRLLHAETLVPADADVANAIGAVVGRVRVESRIVVSRPDDGRYRVLGGPAPLDCVSESEALSRAEALALASAAALARQNGLSDPDLSVATDVVAAPVAGRALILEWRLTGIATGRPGFASSGP